MGNENALSPPQRTRTRHGRPKLVNRRARPKSVCRNGNGTLPARRTVPRLEPARRPSTRSGRARSRRYTSLYPQPSDKRRNNRRVKSEFLTALQLLPLCRPSSWALRETVKLFFFYRSSTYLATLSSDCSKPGINTGLYKLSTNFSCIRVWPVWRKGKKIKNLSAEIQRFRFEIQIRLIN